MLLRFVFFTMFLAFALKDEALQLLIETLGGTNSTTTHLESWSLKVDYWHQHFHQLLRVFVFRYVCPALSTTTNFLKTHLDEKRLSLRTRQIIPEPAAEPIINLFADALRIIEKTYDLSWWICSFGQHTYGLVSLVLPHISQYLPVKTLILFKLFFVSTTAYIMFEGIAVGFYIMNAVCKWARNFTHVAWHYVCGT
ncbi:Nn.00g007340.m01.CDS01 [Neocucurbitaria sp. VM-36]